MTDSSNKKSELTDEASEFGDAIDALESDDSDFEESMPDKKEPTSDASSPRAKIFSIVTKVCSSLLGFFIIYKTVMWLFFPHKEDVVKKSEVNTQQELALINPESAPFSDKKEPSKEEDEALAFLSEVKKLSEDAKNNEITKETSSKPMPPAIEKKSDVAAPAIIQPPVAESKTAVTTTANPTSTEAPTTSTAAADVAVEGMTESEKSATESPSHDMLSTTLVAELNETEKRIEAMDRAVYRLTKRMDQVQDGIGQLSHEMSAVNNAVLQMTKDLKKIGEPMDNPHKTEIAKTEAFMNPTLSVHAIIPGRAWLKDKSGRTLTITEGDMLEQYGKVLVIDAPNSAVITSSGITLR